MLLGLRNIPWIAEFCLFFICWVRWRTKCIKYWSTQYTVPHVKILATPMMYFFQIVFCYCGRLGATEIVERETVAMQYDELMYFEVESGSLVIVRTGSGAKSPCMVCRFFLPLFLFSFFFLHHPGPVGNGLLG